MLTQKLVPGRRPHVYIPGPTIHEYIPGTQSQISVPRSFNQTPLGFRSTTLP